MNLASQFTNYNTFLVYFSIVRCKAINHNVVFMGSLGNLFPGRPIKVNKICRIQLIQSPLQIFMDHYLLLYISRLHRHSHVPSSLVLTGTSTSKFADKTTLAQDKSLNLTVSFWSILQAEGNGHCSVFLKELCSKRIPPQTITLLGKKESHG